MVFVLGLFFVRSSESAPDLGDEVVGMRSPGLNCRRSSSDFVSTVFLEVATSGSGGNMSVAYLAT